MHLGKRVARCMPRFEKYLPSRRCLHPCLLDYHRYQLVVSGLRETDKLVCHGLENSQLHWKNAFSNAFACC